MKIRTLLERDTTASPGASPNALNMFRSLAPLQIGMLKRIANGSFDPLNGTNEKQEEVLDQLVGLGLLDATYGMTSNGERIISISDRVPTAALRDAQQKSAAYRELSKKDKPAPEVEDIDLDDDEVDVGMGEDEGEDEVDMGGTLRAEKKPMRSADRVKELDAEDLDAFDDDDAISMNDDGDYDWK